LLNWTTFGKLILRNIIEIFATRCQILWLKCTKFDFGWASAPDPAGGAYSAPHADPLAGFKGPTSKGRDGGWGRERRAGEGKRREGRGKGRRGREGEEGRRSPKEKFTTTPLALKGGIAPETEATSNFTADIFVLRH